MVNSCSSSAGSSFRELDDVFLQTQTRIWLGEVLGTRLDEDFLISDLLQDGEILFEVSKVLWNLLLTKKELKHLKQKFRPFGSKKIGGRYRPYSNIDSFLKICKILGVSSIDLFSPSDVVEKKNIRQVCICIRALSKKARSKMLTVPDFNVVKYSVPMPTDMVGVIRRSLELSLELSQCTASSSSSYTPQKGSQIKSKQNKLRGQTNEDDNSSSDESDEAESRYMGENNSLSPSSKLNYGYSDRENSPEAHPVSQHNRRNGTGNSNNNTLEKDYSVVGDSSCTSIGENNYISEYLAFSDLMVHANDGDSPVILDGEKNMFDFFLNIDSHELGPQRKFDDDEEFEVSSTTSMSSVLGRLLNFEFDDQFDEDESSSANICLTESKEHETEKPYREFEEAREKCELSVVEVLESESCGSQTLNCENHNFMDNRDISNGDQETHRCEDNDIVQMVNRISDIGISSSDVSSNDLKFSPDSKSDENDQFCSSQGSPPVSDGGSPPVNDTKRAQEDASAAENGSQNNREEELNLHEENVINEKTDTSKQIPPGKRHRRPLLETIAKGTAIAGVLFLLLQIRKSIGNGGQDAKSGAQVSKKKGPKLFFTKPRVGSVGKGIYPTNRIRL